MRDYEYCLSVAGSGDALASKASATQTQSGNVIDLWNAAATPLKDGWGSATYHDIGEDGNIYLNVRLAAAMVGSGAKVFVEIYNHTAATSIKSGTRLAEIELPATLAAGNVRGIGFPKGRVSSRYIGVVYKVSGGTLTSGTFHTWIGRSADTVYVA